MPPTERLRGRAGATPAACRVRWHERAPGTARPGELGDRVTVPTSLMASCTDMVDQAGWRGALGGDHAGRVHGDPVDLAVQAPKCVGGLEHGLVLDGGRRRRPAAGARRASP